MLIIDNHGYQQFCIIITSFCSQFISHDTFDFWKQTFFKLTLNNYYIILLFYFRFLLILFGMQRIRRILFKKKHYWLWLSNAKPGCTEHELKLLKMIKTLIVFYRFFDLQIFLYSLRFNGFCSNTFSLNHFLALYTHYIHAYRHNGNINTHALIWRKPFCIPFAESAIHVFW